MGTEPGDPVPDEVAETARAAFARRGTSGELAPLVYDSLADGATPGDRFWLVFQHRERQLQLAVSPSTTRWDLRGRIDPAADGQAELEIDQSDLALVAPVAAGEFMFHEVPAGVMRIGLSDDRGTPAIQTDWFLIGAHAQTTRDERDA